ncbi:hypothetical protein [Lacinutrix chionoecetis]
MALSENNKTISFIRLYYRLLEIQLLNLNRVFILLQINRLICFLPVNYNLMGIHADKSQENKRQSISYSKYQMQRVDEAAFKFVDNRSKAINNRKLQELSIDSPKSLQLRAYQNKANEHSAKKQPTQEKENNTSLSDNLKTGFEYLSGQSMNDAKFHHNCNRPAQLQVQAYAQGTDTHLGRNDKVKVNDDAHLEREVDIMGKSALQMNSTFFSENAKEKRNTITGGIEPMQPKWLDSKSGNLKWDIPIAGVRWYYIKKDKRMFYLIENGEDRYKSHSGVRHAKSHAEWVQLFGSDPLKYLDALVVSEEEVSSDTNSDSIKDTVEDEKESKKVKLKMALEDKIGALNDIINKTKGNNGYGPAVRDKLKNGDVLGWLLDVLEVAGWDKTDTHNVYECSTLIINEINNFMDKTVTHTNSEDHIKLPDAIEDEFIAFEDAAQELLKKAPAFILAKEEIAQFTLKLKKQSGIFLASETTSGAMDRSIKYLDTLMSMRSKLEKLKDFDFEQILKEAPKKILKKYMLTASFDNNIEPKLAQGIVNKIKDHYGESEGSGQLEENIKDAKKAIVRVIEKLLDKQRSFPIGITGGRKGDTDSGVTKRENNNNGNGEEIKDVKMILIHVGEIMEKLNKNAKNLNILVPALAEYGTLFHELSHSINHHNKSIKDVDIGEMDGGHASPSKVYNMDNTKGWFYDPDFIAAMILAGLDKLAD